jgi:hypothetical protein
MYAEILLQDHALMHDHDQSESFVDIADGIQKLRLETVGPKAKASKSRVLRAL